MISIGIDPGKHGAIVALETFGHVARCFTMPLIKSSKGRDEIDIFALKMELEATVQRGSMAHAYVERPQPLPPRMGGGIANFHRGYGLGLLEGLLSSMSMPYTLVAPQAWQKVMLAGVAGSDTKARALSAFTRLQFPREILLIGKARKPHDGMVDAALIAEYGRRSRG